MKICFVRHGQTDWNIRHLLQGQSDIPLNDYGRKQADTVGKYLKNNHESFDIIASSPLIRAKETAKIIANNIDYPKEVIIINEVIERTFGELEGETLDEAMYQTLELGGHGIEDKKDLIKRAHLALTKIAKTYPDKNVLIVSHAQFIKAVICSIDPTFNFKSLLENSSLNYFEVNDKNDKNDKSDYRIIKINVLPKKL